MIEVEFLGDHIHDMDEDKSCRLCGKKLSEIITKSNRLK